jgi:maltose alpha-D-glucosyltransferase/alpha-amylase
MHNLQQSLAPLYGEEKGKSLTDAITKHYNDLPKPYTFTNEPDWYKNMNFYIVYPDGIEGRNDVPLRNLKDHLDWIRDMGCNAVHILPFLDSPMVDKGFDICNFYDIRQDLGSLEDLLDVKKRAQELGMHTFMDIVFNHISDEHEWFQKAESGDEYYRNFFFYSKERPEYLGTVTNDFGIFAKYLIDGKEKEVYIVFPETVGEIPHWRQGKDGYWYYHTFYPQQLDVNWFNPDVFLEFAKIVMYWASMGFHFRLDAIPFVGKGTYKDALYDDKNTHIIVHAMYDVAKMVNPNCAYLVETYESLDSVIKYFGTANDPEATLAYNFHLCAHTWIALVKRDCTNMREIVKATEQIPVHAEWINFLRNHDELSISFVDDTTRTETVTTLGKKGALFRGGHGLGGRTFSLLGKDMERLAMAYTLIASVPGALGMVYGDDVAMENIDINTLSETDRKDTRNINRGLLPQSLKTDPSRQQLTKTLQEILNKRRYVSYYMNVKPEIIYNEIPEMFACRYTHGTSTLVTFANVSEKEISFEYIFNNGEVVLSVNDARIENNKVILGKYGCLWVQQ